MSRVRLRVSDRVGTLESIHYRCSVRLGRHPGNDCQLADPGVARFQLELAWRDERLVLRSLERCAGVRLRLGDRVHPLVGSELTTTAREVDLAIGTTVVRVAIER